MREVGLVGCFSKELWFGKGMASYGEAPMLCDKRFGAEAP